jgi:hypothetical protein
MGKKTPTFKVPVLKIPVAGVRVTPKSEWIVKRAPYTIAKAMKIRRATATDDNDEGDIDDEDDYGDDDMDDYGDDDMDDYGDDDMDDHGDDDMDDHGDDAWMTMATMTWMTMATMTWMTMAAMTWMTMVTMTWMTMATMARMTMATMAMMTMATMTRMIIDDDMDDYGHDDENYADDDGDDVTPVAHTSSQGRGQHAVTDLRTPRRHSVPHTAPDCLALTTVKQTFDAPHATTIAELTAGIEARMSAHMDERIASFETGYKLVMASLATANAMCLNVLCTSFRDGGRMIEHTSQILPPHTNV